jgi:hypothetical protein
MTTSWPPRLSDWTERIGFSSPDQIEHGVHVGDNLFEALRAVVGPVVEAEGSERLMARR